MPIAIDKPSKYFDTKLYTGNGSTQTITGLNFKPDFVWTKNRTNANSHQLYDAVRGVQKALFSNGNDIEETNANYLTAFNSDGFSVGSSAGLNGSGTNVASWNWLGANTTVSNTSGSITSTVSANTTSGFSIVSYTGTGSNATVGHGLGVALKMLIIKNRSGVNGWPVWHTGYGNAGVMELDKTNAIDTNPVFLNSTIPTSTVFSIGTAGHVNNSGSNYIAYCFTDVKGYSKYGSYVGNGSADGTFVYTGFKPAFIMIKQTGSGGNWLIQDNKRLGYNKSNSELFANLADAESTNDRTDLLSNGFKARINSGENNSSGVTYIYMAFAENPFVSSKGIPTTAR